MAVVGLLERDSLTADARVEIDASAEPLLSDRVRPLVGQVVELIIREGDRQRIPWIRVTISGVVHWDEGDHKIYVSQKVLLPAKEACAYWDSLEAPIRAWMSGLSEGDVDTFHHEISVQVDW